MEVILTQDVPQLGYKGDVIKVKPGYARNYLIPQGFGVTASDTNRKIWSENLRQAARKITQAKDKSIELATELQDLTIEIPAKTGSNGRIFGSITTLQVAQALKEKGYDIDRRKIALSGEIKQVGAFTANIDLHKEVKATVKLVIIPEEVA